MSDTRLLSMLVVAVLGIACSGPAIESAADFVFTNGKVYTVNEAQPWAEAVAVQGNIN